MIYSSITKDSILEQMLPVLCMEFIVQQKRPKIDGRVDTTENSNWLVSSSASTALSIFGICDLFPALYALFQIVILLPFSSTWFMTYFTCRYLSPVNGSCPFLYRKMSSHSCNDRLGIVYPASLLCYELMIHEYLQTE